MTATASFASILHPTDFSAASELAFVHALKLALLTRAHFDIVHTEHPDREGIDWAAFPGVRATLERWGLLAPGAPPAAVAEQLGMRVRKVDVRRRDPIEGVVRFINEHPCDLVVLATHGRSGWQRWRSGSIAEPIARAAHTPTLFLPHAARGFVDPDTGGVALRRILIAVDHDPRPEPAVTEAWQLANALGAADACLLALHVGAAGEAPALRSLPEVGGRVEPIARQGGVVDRIVETAAEHDVDLIAMATRGPGRAPRQHHRAGPAPRRPRRARGPSPRRLIGRPLGRPFHGLLRSHHVTSVVGVAGKASGKAGSRRGGSPRR